MGRRLDDMRNRDSNSYVNTAPPVLGGWGDELATVAGLGALAVGYRYNRAKAAKALANEAKLTKMTLGDTTKSAATEDAAKNLKELEDIKRAEDIKRRLEKTRPAADEDFYDNIAKSQAEQDAIDLADKRSLDDAAARNKISMRRMGDGFIGTAKPKPVDLSAFDDDIYRPLIDEVQGPPRPKTMPKTDASSTPQVQGPWQRGRRTDGVEGVWDRAPRQEGVDTPFLQVQGPPRPRTPVLTNVPEAPAPAPISFDPNADDLPTFKTRIKTITDIDVLEDIRPLVKAGRLNALNSHINSLRNPKKKMT